jgi:hypothetical protein
LKIKRDWEQAITEVDGIMEDVEGWKSAMAEEVKLPAWWT